VYFIKTVGFKYKSASRINPFLMASASAHVIVQSSQRQRCLDNNPELDPQFPVAFNFYDANKLCEGVDVDRLHTAILDHEEGHHLNGEEEAGKAINDAHRIVEDVVGTSQDFIVTRVELLLDDVADRIKGAAGSHGGSTVHWRGTIYLWDPAADYYAAQYFAFLGV
jgi:hypothetical protein